MLKPSPSSPCIGITIRSLHRWMTRRQRILSQTLLSMLMRSDCHDQAGDCANLPAWMFSEEELVNHCKIHHRVIRARFFSIAIVGAFLIAISEMGFMASPFSAYFYSAYSPVF